MTVGLFCCYCQFLVLLFYVVQQFLSNFLFFHIFAAPQQIGLSKWKNYGKYVHKNARILIPYVNYLKFEL